MCLRGVSSLQEEWLDARRGDDVAVFVVWSDQLGAAPRHVAEAAELMRDPRARHYWDGGRVVGKAYQNSLEAGGTNFMIGTEAWDVWLLFDGDAVWGDSGPPVPVWWEHQLGRAGLPPDRQLDPERFAAKAVELRRSPPVP